MFNIGPWELIMILAVALIVVGPGKLPEAGKALGRSIREFKKATSDIKNDIDDIINVDDPPKDQK